MAYEDVLIREATERHTPWCSDCERDADECVCEEICDHFRSEDVGVFNSGADVRVFPAAPEYPLQLPWNPDHPEEGDLDPWKYIPVPAVVSEPAQWEKAALKEIDAI